LVAQLKLDLWLVRHGETEWNAAGRFCGWSDPPLNPEGRSQAQALRKPLTALHFDSFVSSPSKRAAETARLAYGAPLLDERLRELDFGLIEGSTWMDCSADVQERLRDYDTFQAPNGESAAQLSERVLEALLELGSGRHLVFTHGGVIRLLLGRAGETSYPPVGSISRLQLTVEEGVPYSWKCARLE
jgi:2,3-bisphosphoglycerate-dependent phosphoglycerate mutase